MKKYWKYLKYLLEHKKNVFIVCWKKKMYLHAFTHDLSKFLPDEFFPYANWFYGEYGQFEYNKLKELNKKFSLEISEKDALIHSCRIKFNKAWKKHYTRNKHHWNYWSEWNVPIITVKYIKQMICDWESMGIKFGDTAKEYYEKNKDRIKINKDSREVLEHLLNGE